MQQTTSTIVLGSHGFSWVGHQKANNHSIMVGNVTLRTGQGPESNVIEARNLGARGLSPVAENGFKAFHRAKMSPQDTQVNTISCIFSSKNQIK